MELSLSMFVIMAGGVFNGMKLI